MYIATVPLNQSERTFWRMTPRKLFALWAVHLRANGAAEQVVGIDYVM